MTTNGTERHAAVTQWRAAAAAGQEMTGTQLGEQFGRSARWGRDRIAEARKNADAISIPERQESGEALVRPVETAAAEARGNPSTPKVSERHEPLPQRRPWHESALVLVVAAVAAAASYGHMRAVAVMAGEPEWIAYLFPLTVDGLVLAALRRGEEGRWWLALALAVSVASNVAAAEATVLGRLVAAWPPLALYGTHRLLHQVVK